MPRIIISTTNDIATDNRVGKVADLLLGLGYDVCWVGRKLPNSMTLEKPYETHRFRLLFNKGPLFYAEFNLRLFFFLWLQSADVLLSNDLDTLLANFLVSKLRGRDLVYDSHEYFLGVPEIQDNPLAKSVWTRIEYAIFPKLKHVFTVNEAIANLYDKDHGIKPKVFRNISPIPHLDFNETRRRLGLPEDKRIVINQGAGMNVDRGIEEAIQAVQSMDDVVLLLVGDGDVIPKMKSYVASNGLEDKVIFKPKMPYAQLLQYTHLADVGISLDKDSNINYRYSLPNKLFDYIHCKIPVVCSGVVEVKRVVEKYHIGEIVKSHHPEDIKTSLEKVLSLGKGHYDDALTYASRKENWDLEKTVLLEVYNQWL